MKADKHIDNFINEVLEMPPTISLSADFSKKVESKIQNVFSWKSYLSQFALTIGVICLLLVTIGVMYYFIDSERILLTIEWLKEYKPLLILCTCTFIFVLFSNNVLLNYFFFLYKQDRKHYL